VLLRNRRASGFLGKAGSLRQRVSGVVHLNGEAPEPGHLHNKSGVKGSLPSLHHFVMETCFSTFPTSCKPPSSRKQQTLCFTTRYCPSTGKKGSTSLLFLNQRPQKDQISSMRYDEVYNIRITNKNHE
jgi:hypothetical protein